MPALVAEYRHHKVGGAIHHLGAVQKGRVGIDEAAQADHLLDLVEIAERRLDLCQHVDRAGACRFLFFFSSRRRHTISYGDWSSDVCSSDLARWGWLSRAKSRSR